MQLTYFVVYKVVQGYNCGKTVPIFDKQTEALDTHDEKSQAALYVLTFLRNICKSWCIIFVSLFSFVVMIVTLIIKFML